MGEALMIQGDLGVGASYVRKARAFNDAIGWLGPQTFEKSMKPRFLPLKCPTIRIRGARGQLIVEHSEQVIALDRLAQMSVASGFHRAR
jgi:hypothetical protein